MKNGILGQLIFLASLVIGTSASAECQFVVTSCIPLMQFKPHTLLLDTLGEVSAPTRHVDPHICASRAREILRVCQIPPGGYAVTYFSTNGVYKFAAVVTPLASQLYVTGGLNNWVPLKSDY